MLPEGWKEKTVGACAEIGRGFAFKSEQYVVSGFPVLRVSNIENNGKISTAGEWKYIPVSDVSKYRNYLVRKDDILLVMVGATAGKIGIVQEYSEKYLLNQNMWILRSREDDGLEQRYFSYIVRDLVGRFLETLQGSARAFFRQSDFLKSTLVLPPLPEQKKIAAILSTWDRAIEVTEKLLANSQQQKKALMQQLLTGKKRLPGFTGEWVALPLNKVAQLTKGEQLNRLDCVSNGVFPVINGGITPSGYTNDYNRTSKTITISEGGNSCGYVDYQKEKFWCGGHCYSVEEYTVSRDFLYQNLKFLQPKVMKLRVGSGLPNLQKKSLEGLPIYHPVDLNEQQAIAAVLMTSDEEITAIESDLARLRQEKKALMQQLLTGKRRVQVQ